MNLTEEDIISDDIKEAIMASKRKKIEEQHNCRIWQASDGRWKTYYQDSCGKRKLIAYKHRDDLIDKLAELYYDDTKNPHIVEIFEEWLDDKLKKNEISKTSAGRYRQDFDRYFKRYGWDQKRIRSVTMDNLTEHVKDTIVNEKLTQKTFGNFRIIIRGIFFQARKEKLCDFNIKTLIDDMFISKKSFTVKKKDATEEILNDYETEKMITYLNEHKDPLNMAILLVFYTGLRIGELCALKKTDIVDGEYLHIQRTETYVRNQCQIDNKTSTDITDCPKTESGDRYIFLSQEARDVIQWLLDYTPNDTEWLIVSGNQKRIVRATLHRRLTKVCNEIEIPHRSMHKIRKTYASRLIDSGVDENLVIRQLGHSNIDVTKNYYYFTHQMKDEQAEQLSRAVKDYNKKVIKSKGRNQIFTLVNDDFKRVHGIS